MLLILGDANAPATNLSPNFEKTAVIQMARTAGLLTIALSCLSLRIILKGISYEPWHWRFVGDSHSLETFYKAQEFTSSSVKVRNRRQGE